eukprot:2292137-Amphidinium_carterae.2
MASSQATHLKHLPSFSWLLEHTLFSSRAQRFAQTAPSFIQQALLTYPHMGTGRPTVCAGEAQGSPARTFLPERA